MSNITMDQVAVMGVQYFHYTLDYYLNSMHRCGVKNLDLWGASPHYCRLDYLTSSAAERKLREIRKKAEDLGLKFVMYTPETLAYPYSLSAPEQPIRDRTIDYFDMAIDDALTLGTTRLFMNSGCGPLDIPREDSWKRAVETISKVCEMAHKRGVTILLEQLQPYESNLLVNLPQMKAMLEEVNSPALKTCAASAVLPAKRPTTTTSAALNSSCRMLEAASGMENRMIFWSIGPLVRSAERLV